MARIVLAYSGGRDASSAVSWLRDTQDADVIAVTVDVGQGQQLEAVRDRALAAGAVRAHVLDLREELARDFIVPALKADALSETGVPVGPALIRPLIAHALVKIAGIEQAAAVAHGGADRSPLDTAVRALNPALRIIAASSAHASTPHLTAAASSPLRADGSLWGRTVSGAALDEEGGPIPEALYALTKPAAERPAEPASVEIAFERGAPAAINGVAMPLLEMLNSLATIAGAHGVGRIVVQQTVAGVSRRTLHEAPAAFVLHAAHRELQALVTAPELDRFSRVVSREYAHLVCGGLWYSPLRGALDAFVDRIQERVTGRVRLKLFNGDCRIVGRTSPHAGHDDGAPQTQDSVVGA